MVGKVEYKSSSVTLYLNKFQKIIEECFNGWYKIIFQMWKIKFLAVGRNNFSLGWDLFPNYRTYYIHRKLRRKGFVLTLFKSLNNKMSEFKIYRYLISVYNIWPLIWSLIGPISRLLFFFFFFLLQNSRLMNQLVIDYTITE